MSLTRDQIMQRLRQLQNMKAGEPMPDWMQQEPYDNWGEALSELMRDAANLIERLEGAVDVAYYAADDR